MALPICVDPMYAINETIPWTEFIFASGGIVNPKIFWLTFLKVELPIIPAAILEKAPTLIGADIDIVAFPDDMACFSELFIFNWSVKIPGWILIIFDIRTNSWFEDI